MESFWGPMIASYSRAEAIEDGALVDVTELARVHWPARDAGVVVTAGVFAELDCSEGENLADVVRAAALAMGDDESDERTPFAVNGRWLYALAHAGDEGEACVTIMLEGED